jgi:hypothetical protein
MSETIACPQCDDIGENGGLLARRNFLRLVGGGAALAAANCWSPLRAADVVAPAAKAAGPAEALVREFYDGLTEAQRKIIVLPWDHRAKEGAQLTRLGMYNRAISQPVSRVLEPNQRELVQKIVRNICSDDEGFKRISTVVTRDTGGGWNNIGANVFGDPDRGPFAWVLSAHHLTLRCDGDSEPDAAFGGPMYYGHSLDGRSPDNVFNFQTQSVRKLFDALTEAQRAKALVDGQSGELYPSVQLRKEDKIPGLVTADLSADQHTLVKSVMRDLLSPFRHEDAEEAMSIVDRTGGLDHLRLAFYKDHKQNDEHQWSFWRIEGPGFVWNYRIIPHVHCYVNIGVNRTA